jgi:hypothetical protein
MKAADVAKSGKKGVIGVRKWPEIAPTNAY